jgi:hypothetical protein
VENAVFKFTVKFITARLGKNTSSLNNIGKHLSFVNASNITLAPTQFSISMHLGAHELSNVMASVRPFEFSESINLIIDQVSTVNVKGLRS